MTATKIIRHVREEHCLPRLEGSTKEEVILELSQTFVSSGSLTEAQRRKLVETVMEREGKGTTGIGNGVALPHQTTPEAVKSVIPASARDDVLVAVGLHPDGVDFAAVDGAPVQVVFLVMAADGAEYLQLARRIAALARDRLWTRHVRRCTTAKAMRETLDEAWAELAP